MILDERVRVVGDSEWFGQCGVIVGIDDEGFAKVRFSIWGNVSVVKIWMNYLRPES